jgi:NAD+ diphosphatase
MHRHSFSLEYLADGEIHHPDGIFVFFEGNDLVEIGGVPGVLSKRSDLQHVQSNLLNSPIHIGGYDDRHYFAQELQSGTAEENGLASTSLRSLGGEDEILFALLSRGLQLINWRRNHKHCGRCGAETAVSTTEHAMKCTQCAVSFYPKIMPCIMALVIRGNECLLARHAKRGTGIYTALAGFIEAGESVEHAIYREVLEEVGIKTGKVSYFSSQAWPFPSQLMLGFYAEYLEGEIIPQQSEIADAQWFSVGEYPDIPAPFTLSGKLIRSFTGEESS